MPLLSDQTKIGLALTGFGVFFTVFGVFMFFDRGLLAFGNLLFLTGVIFTIGAAQTLSIFRSDPLRGALPFASGVFLVVVGLPVFGFLLEMVGAYFLFGSFLPYLVTWGRALPFVGPLFTLGSWFGEGSGDSSSAVREKREGPASVTRLDV